MSLPAPGLPSQQAGQQQRRRIVDAQARHEAVRYVSEHGKELYGEEFWEEKNRAFERIEASIPEQGIVREFKAADDALQAALDLSSVWNLPPETA